jgi:exopolysaccharide biosynthesis polyprenyl glycosylphosphotransferase
MAEPQVRTWLRVGSSFRHSRLTSVLKTFDLIMITLSIVVAISLSAGLGPAELLAIPIKGFQCLALALLVVAWSAGASTLKFYDTWRVPRSNPRTEGARSAVLLGVCAGIYGALLLGPELLSPGFVASFAGVSLAGLAVRRGLPRLVCGRNSPDSRQLQRALVVGTGIRARSIARKIEKDPTLGTRVLGFVDDDWPGMSEFRAARGILACDLKNLDEFLRDHSVDELVVALPLSELLRQRSRLLALSRSFGLTLRFPVSQLADLESQGIATRDDLLLSVYHGRREGWEPLLKRLLDLSLASVLLVAAVPLLAAIAVVVKFESPGRAFFVQERVGLNRRRFRMYKFRTMVSDAEASLAAIEHLNETGGPTFKLKKDPRITRVGSWLRRSSLDELPQLVNVIRGEMSLVGPRPLPVRDVEGFEDDRHQRRFSVPPGLTGPWQVSGRNTLSFQTWMELDLRYVDEWSLGLDLWILAKTIPAVLTGEGAE